MVQTSSAVNQFHRCSESKQHDTDLKIHKQAEMLLYSSLVSACWAQPYIQSVQSLTRDAFYEVECRRNAVCNCR